MCLSGFGGFFCRAFPYKNRIRPPWSGFNGPGDQWSGVQGILVMKGQIGKLEEECVGYVEEGFNQ